MPPADEEDALSLALWTEEEEDAEASEIEVRHPKRQGGPWDVLGQCVCVPAGLAAAAVETWPPLKAIAAVLLWLVAPARGCAWPPASVPAAGPPLRLPCGTTPPS